LPHAARHFPLSEINLVCALATHTRGATESPASFPPNRTTKRHSDCSRSKRSTLSRAQLKEGQTSTNGPVSPVVLVVAYRRWLGANQNASPNLPRVDSFQGAHGGVYATTTPHQLRQTMRNLLDNLEETGMEFSEVVSTNVYLDDLADLQSSTKSTVNTLIQSCRQAPRSSRLLRWNVRRIRMTTIPISSEFH
jgi:enamine deaminase RidA (YjgF/YER057c/UK114 family)